MGAPHTEQHFQSSALVRDIVIGMADGLTVPFALAAGISGVAAGMQLVVTAGIAEIAAGSIAMGLGGYLAAHSERQHYYAERAREEQEIRDLPRRERREIIDIMARYGVTREECAPLLAGLERDPAAWRDFMMRFELGLEEPDRTAAKRSALTIALSYIVGGFIPLSPYMLMEGPRQALLTSAAVTLCALWIFGYLKGRYSGTGALRSALQTLGVGGLAAGAAFCVARLIA
ncbi:VIT1/CCC1 transporter family protein [Janthinobacterium fluminis]|uniref:VIT1/CCC1 transporter family protein n=1 Tax=Janthinobacterium fluminis TaxID=2987524 RepID=A0ABT5K0C7_9BURK|nr:VIT1/CCC1 transporter family protein [Janthinobacterium fluminis]MDC8757212.1 VIT1/CCC1 transporter family protein [Janthinobacterium fluminis]